MISLIAEFALFLAVFFLVLPGFTIFVLMRRDHFHQPHHKHSSMTG